MGSAARFLRELTVLKVRVLLLWLFIAVAGAPLAGCDHAPGANAVSVAPEASRTPAVYPLSAEPGKRYPDFGCSFETFTNDEMLELETLGALVELARGRTVEHRETWMLKGGVKFGKWTDAELDRVLSR